MFKSIKSGLRRAVWAMSGRFDHLNVSVCADKQWCGNEYGGFYICPKGLGPDSIVYSVGVGEDISFDEVLIEQYGCQIHAFDPTPKSIAWVQRRPDLPPNFVFHPYGIGAESGPAHFYLPKNPDHISGSFVSQSNVDTSRSLVVELKSLRDIALELGHTQIDLLKLDIEGAEYLVLDSILGVGLAIGQVLIEFHERMFEDGKEQTTRAIEKLRENGFGIFAISSNFEDISFISNSQ